MSADAARRPGRLARAERVDAILDAAREAFCANGYEATTVAAIAGRMGVVEGTVYKYFDSKRDLLLQVLERWYGELVEDYARDLAGVTGARARLHLMIWRHLRAVHDAPRLCRLMFREVRSEHDYRDSALYRLNRRYAELLMQVLRQGVAAGELRDDLPVALLRDMIFGGIEHHTWHYLSGHGTLDIDAIADKISALLWQGVGSRTSALQRETRRLSNIVNRIERGLTRP